MIDYFARASEQLARFPELTEREREVTDRAAAIVKAREAGLGRKQAQ